MDNLLQRVRLALADSYAVEAEVGRGGMAVVYLGTDLRHERSVAIKILSPQLASAIGHERFLQEIRLAAGLSHPYILPLLDSGETKGLVYYTMPFVEGENLRERLVREPQLPIEDALRIAGEMAEALGHAHALGIVHRDVKPSNILLTREHAMLADFGVARAIDRGASEHLTGTGLSVGTPAYMSPQQGLADERVDGASDQYSLACVVYEMLAGRPPFAGPTPDAVLRHHVVDPPPPLRA
ncbi:MAG: serine/threonine-protein kinase, partial [Gemmatimonadota bacterium]